MLEIDFVPPELKRDRGIRKHTAGTEINDIDRLMSDYHLRGGHPAKYRGNHRSQTRGAGIMAFFRSLRLRRYTHITNR